MTSSRLLALVLAACTSTSTPPATAPASPPPPPPAPVPAPKLVHLDADTPETTALGNTFIAPAGWTLEQRGTASILTPPEGGSTLAIVDIANAADATAAANAAWQVVTGAAPKWPVAISVNPPDRDGWSKSQVIQYKLDPAVHRVAVSNIRFANGAWTVIVVDFDVAVGEKRTAQLQVAGGKLLPKGGAQESFAGKTPHELDADRLAAIAKHITDAEAALNVPGVGYGIVQHGKVVFAGGIGVRDMAKPAKIDADTAFMIASNTKQLTTLMLAKLVDAGKLAWDAPVTSVLPQFKLGSDEVTKQVEVKHLICACTGLPRQDLEFLFNFKAMTPESALGVLGTMQPTSKFGELFQYSNLMAAAGGFVGGHVAFPKLELGAAYDRAMQSLVFDPLGMRSTTFDYARALHGDHATPHAEDIDGKLAYAPLDMDRSAIPVRPAGAAWSTVRDMLAYVEMELGHAPKFISEGPLREREKPQVAIGPGSTYGMGLVVDNSYGITIVSHGGSIFGFHSDVFWLPQFDVGAVVLTNSDGGSSITTSFRRKLLEQLFDGAPLADAAIAVAAKAAVDSRTALRKGLTIPADPAVVKTLAAKYANDALGTLVLSTKDGKSYVTLPVMTSEIATRKNDDGTVSIVMLAPGLLGQDWLIRDTALVIRDAQHEYVYTPVK